ncbi:unnamed protein product [Camellia sinensis]
MKENLENPLRLTSLNHVSLVCRSLEKSIDFYTNVLGFVPVRRPNSFNFDGACCSVIKWITSFAIRRPRTYDEEKQNQSQGQSYFIPDHGNGGEEAEGNGNRMHEADGGIHVDQQFFHDPDGFIIEICNYDNIPIVPLSGEVVRSCSQVNLKKKMQHQQQQIQVVQP